MKVWIVMMMAVGLCSISGRADEPVKPAVTTGKPKIQFDKTAYDFGKTSGVSSVTGTFTFHNAGDGELQIRKPAPSCGCTVATVKPNTLKPGEKGELVFTVNISNVRGVAQKSITVPSNDPEKPNTQLTIHVEVAQLYDITPRYITFGDITQGVITNATIHIKRVDGQKLEIDHVTSSNPQVRASAAPVADSNGQAAEVTVTAEGEGTPHRFSEQVQIFIKGQDAPIGSVAVHGRLVGDVSVVPERLTWGIGNLGRLPASRVEAFLTRSVRITASKPDQKLELHDAESTLKDLKLEMVTLETGKTYLVRAKLAEPPKQSEHGTITVHTNLASQPLVEVPFTINVVQQR